MEHAGNLVIVLNERATGSAKAGAKSFRKARPEASRVLAYEVLQEVNRAGAFSNLLLPKRLSESALDARDRGFATELVYGTLRMQGLYDWILAQVSDRPWSEVETGIVDVSRLGLHQLFSMRVPDHAAVSSTVEVARHVVGDSKASYVNALLRKVSTKSLSQWLEPLLTIADPVERLAIKYSHPEWIVSAYFDLLRNEDEVELVLEANNLPASPTLVSWPGRSTVQDLLDLGGEATKYSPYGASSMEIPSEISLIRSRMAGVQDEGSQIVATVFSKSAQEKKNWLDLCAGPGGKAALLSSIAAELGAHFSTNEVSQVRADLVKQVVVETELWVGDGRTFAEHGLFYDAIIADVPCTGIGALRRRPEVRWRRKASDLSELITLQSALLDSAIEVCEINGVIAYVTCSPHMAETKVQVASALKRHPEIVQMPVNSFLPPGLDDAIVNGCMQLWTHKHGTDAMFLALFQKIA